MYTKHKGAIATCDCQAKSSTFIKTEIIYSESAGDFVCLHCLHFPIWERSTVPTTPTFDTSNVSEFLDYWGTDSALDDYSFIFGQRRGHTTGDLE